MRKIYFLLLLLLYSSFANAQTHVSGNQNGVWTTANSPYIIDGTVTVDVNQTLTIQPGVEVQFNSYDMSLIVYGTLNAIGTASDSIRFTGKSNFALNSNSSHGGAIILSGNSYNSSASNSLQYVAVDRMGDVYTYGYALQVSGNNVSITNSNIRNSENTGIAIGANTKPIISSCRFEQNAGYGIMANWLGGGEFITSNTNVIIGLQGSTGNSDCILSRPGTNSFYETAGSLTVEYNGKLTMQPGVEIRFPAYDHSMFVYGSLDAIGTVSDSIRFTGKPNFTYNINSSHGGAIILSGNSYNSSASNSLQYVAVDRMGDVYTYGYALQVSGNNVSITNSNIRNSENTGIAIGSNTKPVISSCRFEQNAGYSIMANWLGGGEFITNNTNVIIGLQGSTGTSNCILSRPGTNSFYETAGSLTVEYNGKLTIHPGVEIRFPGYDHSMFVYGSLDAIGTASDSIRFTGKPNFTYNINSSHGGAIILSGNSYNSSASNSLQYVAVDRMGDVYTYGYALQVAGNNVSITNSNIRNSEQTGIRISGNAKPIINGNIFSNTTRDIETGILSAAFLQNNQNARIWLQSSDLSENGLLKQPGSNSWYVLESAITVNTGSTLTIEPGTQIDFRDYNGYISVYGTLKAVGTEALPINFVKLPGSGSSNFGGGVSINNGSTASDLSYVNFNKIGSQLMYGSALVLNTSAVTLSHITIANSENIGLLLNNVSPVVNMATIMGNVIGVSANGEGTALFNNCNINNNSSKGIDNLSSTETAIIDARNCWWGSTSGPQHSSNTSGTGNLVSDKVLFNPWRMAPATTLINDIGVSAVLSPVSGCSIISNPTVKVRINNYGNTPQSGFNVSYRLNNGTVVTENTGSLSIPGFGNAEYTFTQKPDVSGMGTSYAIKAYTTLAGDTTRSNDSTSALIEIFILAVPTGLIPAHDSVGVNKPAAFSWSPVANASSYSFYVWPASEAAPASPTVAGIQQTYLSYNNAALVFGQTYRWKIRALKDSCFSESGVHQFTLRNLPDLAVSSVTSNKTVLTPDEAVTITWNVANAGVAPLTKNWSEYIYIQSSAGENRTMLSHSVYNDPGVLNTGQSVARNVTLSIPFQQLYVGDEAVFVVEVIPGPGVQEAPEAAANNLAVQSTPWLIKKILLLNVPATEITEGVPQGITYVQRTGSLANPLTVNISCRTNAVTYPSSVVIPAGYASQSFMITAVENNIITGVLTDTLIVYTSGFEPDSSVFNIIDNDFASLTVANLPQQAAEGDTVRFQVVTSHPSPLGVQVFLNSGNQVRFPLPSFVTIPANSVSSAVSVVLQQNTIPETETTISIKAAAVNHLPLDTGIVITDDDVPGIQLVLQTDIVSESAGLYALQATLRRTSLDNATAFTANLSASMADILILPASVSLAAGENEKTFTIGVIDNTVVDTLRTVQITAAVFIAACGCSAPPMSAGSVSAVLKVSDNDGPSLQISATPQTLPEGSSEAGILRIARNTPATAALQVNLFSSDTTEARLPITVQIPIGQMYIDIPIATIDDDSTDGNQTVFLEARANGNAAGITWVVVTDQNQPDLVIPVVTLSNTSAQPGTIVSYEVTVQNSGSATAPVGATLLGYLSADDVLDSNDTLISQVTIPSAIPSGQMMQSVQAFMTPDRPGNYKLLFKINPDQVIKEFNANNNISPATVFNIIAAYTATANVAATYFLKGTAVTIAGTATKTDGSPAANKPVDVFITTNGLVRKITATTNASGNYSTQFVPLAAEAGHYRVGACYPAVNDTTGQDTFDIAGVKINNFDIPRFSVFVNDTLRGKLAVQNLSNKTLNNLSLSSVTLPDGASMLFGTIPSLAGNASDSISYTVTGAAVSPGNNYFTAAFNVTAAEGIIQPAGFYYYCQAPNAHLSSSISRIDVNVSQAAGEKLVEFKLINRGAAASGNITVSLPQVNWLSSVTPLILPSLTPGDTGVVVLKFRAQEGVPFSYPINGNIAISAQNGNSFTVPFTFEKVATSNGTVKITTTNFFTYYNAGAPKVSGALVKIKNFYSGAVVAQGYTDSAGSFTGNNIPDGNYRITIEKDKHVPYNNTLVVNAGDTTTSVVFLSYQAITFSWNVVPTGIQDQYTITLTSQFETNIPIPVVTIDMPDSLPPVTGSQVYPFTVTLTNHGLITAKDVTLNLPLDSTYEFVHNYQTMDIGAKQSIQVPVLLRRRTTVQQGGRYNPQSYTEVSEFLGIQEPQPAGFELPSFDCPLFTLNVTYWFQCNASTGQWQPVSKQFKIPGFCGSPGGGGGTAGTAGGGGGYNGGTFPIYYGQGAPGPFGTGPIGVGFCPTCPNIPVPPPPPPVIPPPFVNLLKNCNLPSCIWGLAQAAKTLEHCGTTAAAIKNAIKSARFGAAIGGIFGTPIGGVGGGVGAAAGAIAGTIPYIPSILWNGYNCIDGLRDIIEHCPELANAIGSMNDGRLYNQPNSFSDNPAIYVVANIVKDMVFVEDAFKTQKNWCHEYFGTSIYNSTAWDYFGDKVLLYVRNKDTIPQIVQDSILNEIAGYNLSQATVTSFFTRWNTSIHALRNNILQPNAEFPNIINWIKVSHFEDSLDLAKTRLEEADYEYGLELYEARYDELIDFLNQQKDAVCASVSVQFTQQLTMTREAFAGTLGIFNGHPSDAMDSIRVDIRITDASGIPANNHFEIQTTDLTHITDVTGTGSIDSEQTGSVRYLFIPKISAAPTVPKIYNFGGSVTYWDPFADTLVTIPLNAVPITVNPSPDIALHYFMQRNILGDDPLTSPAIEPSVPAQLSVMVANKGYGPANNLTISSAQPKIVDNEKSLAIDFNLVGSSFQGQPANLGVTDIGFGTIPPLQARTGEWYFTSSLLGKFVNYEAEVVHNNSFGNPELSLVSSVKIHELTKSIREYGATADNINDFLVNDIFDIHDRPDIIYFSQGNRTAPVLPATSGSFSSPVSPPSFINTLTVQASAAGWNYIKLDDPGQGSYSIAGIVRSDGQTIPVNNGWLSFVTLPVSNPPVYENKFHFIDSFRTTSPVNYTVTWSPKNTEIPAIDSITGVSQQVVASAVKNLTIHFNKRIDPATFTYQDLSLSHQGGGNIMDASVVITQIDTATFNVNIASLATSDGLYTFTAQAAGVNDSYGISGLEGKQVEWSQFIYAPAVQAFEGIPLSRTDSSFKTIRILFNLPVDETTVTPARFIITKNGVIQNIPVIIDSVRSDRKLFYLSNIQNILTSTGEYQLLVDMPSIRSLTNIPGVQQQSIILTLDKTPPFVVSLNRSDSGAIDAQHVPFIKIKLNENIAPFNISAVRLTRNGSLLPLAITQLTEVDPMTWTAGNFDLLTYPEGNYVFTVILDSLKDKVGNRGSGIAQLAWTVNRVPLMAISNLSVSPDLGYSNSDNVTSGSSFNVNFHLSAAATQVTIAQFDISGESILSIIPSAAAGNISVPLMLTGVGNTGIKVTAYGNDMLKTVQQKSIFIDQEPLTAQWQLGSGQTILRQPDTIGIVFSSRLLSTTGFMDAVELKKDDMIVPAGSVLHLSNLNDTAFVVHGFRQLITQPGTYKLKFNTRLFNKYSSGKTGVNDALLQWTVQSPNRAPVANAGNDTIMLSHGTIRLNGSSSYDPDSDAITYKWVAPPTTAINDSSLATPMVVIPAGSNDTTYTFLLIVQDGNLFSTDVVNVMLRHSVCNGAVVHFTQPKPGEAYQYQWQIDSTGTGFVPLIPDAFHTGTTTDTLNIFTPPSSYYGYRYRRVASKGSFVQYGSIQTLRFANVWTGDVNNNWNNTGNWSCGSVPDKFTDVIIPSNRLVYPTIQANTACRSITAYSGAVINIAAGVQLQLTGNK